MSVSDQDGNSSQNERRKQVGVDVVSGAVQPPVELTHMHSDVQQRFRFSRTAKCDTVRVLHFKRKIHCVCWGQTFSEIS